jgi:hypothetical protein
MASNKNGGKVKAGVHAHEKNIHPGKKLTKMPFKTTKNENKKTK